MTVGASDIQFAATHDGSFALSAMPTHAAGDLIVTIPVGSNDKFSGGADGETIGTAISGHTALRANFQSTDTNVDLVAGAHCRVALSSSESPPEITTTYADNNADVVGMGVFIVQTDGSFDCGNLPIDMSAGLAEDEFGHIDHEALDVTGDNRLVIAVGVTATTYTAAAAPTFADMMWAELDTPAGIDLALLVAYDLQTTETDISAAIDTNAFELTSEANAAKPELSFIFSIGDEAETAPTITSALTCGTRDADGMNCAVTVDEDSTGHMVACRVNSATPTDAQLKVGDCTGDEDALEYETASLTATVSWSAHFTGLASRPAYDIYFIATNAGGDSAQDANVDEERGCATVFGGDCDIFPLTSLAMAGWAALSNMAVFGDAADETFWGTTTEIAAGDWVEIATVGSIIGCEFTHTTTGDFTVAGVGGVGDCPSAKESVRFGIMSATTGNLFASAGATYPGSYEGQYDFLYLNNGPPTCPEGSDHPFQTGEAYSRDFSLEISDPDGDAIDLAVFTGAVINGLAHSGTGNLLYSGTVDDMDEDETGSEITRRFDDGTGDHCFVADVEWPIDTITVPDLVGSDTDEAITLELAAFPFRSEPTLDTSETDYSDTVPAGDIISQDPAASTEVAFDQELSGVVSLGEEPPPLEGGRGGRRPFGLGLGVN
jgi:hypothetical protein